MVDRIEFQKEDIGAEILPILTTGLYRNALDTLREYIQNSIDAKATKIELVVDPDVVSIRDDGAGMIEASARRAIRLGISEKSPLDNVGFRGIGIYSALNLCDQLVMHTRARRQKTGYMLQFEFKRMRDELLQIKGIGPETADSILLYGLEKLVFVVDRYTCRILWRHYLLDEDIDYDYVQQLFTDALPADLRIYNEYHALLVALGKNYCRPRPRCSACPLAEFTHRLEDH